MSLNVRINLKLLHAFILVAEHASFRQAAERSNRSQSAVSSQIRQLESQLGLALFHRTTRRVQLTLEGEELLQRARSALAEVEAGLRQIREAVDIRRGRVSFACSPTVASTRLPAILAAFTREYPAITVHMKETTSRELFDMIRKGEADFGIGPSVEAAEFEFESVLRDPLLALVPRTLLPGRRNSVTLRALEQLPLLLLDSATAMRNLLERAMAAEDLTANERYCVSSVATLIAMAAEGLGAAIVPKIALPARVRSDLAILRITPVLERQICIINLKGRSLPPAANRLVNLVRRRIRDADK